MTHFRPGGSSSRMRRMKQGQWGLIKFIGFREEDRKWFSCLWPTPSRNLQYISKITDLFLAIVPRVVLVIADWVNFSPGNKKAP